MSNSTMKAPPSKKQRNLFSFFAKPSPSSLIDRHLTQIQVGTRISVFWPDDNEYYAATVMAKKRHLVSGDNSGASKNVMTLVYDDGDVETVDLTKEQFKVLNSGRLNMALSSNQKKQSSTAAKSKSTNNAASTTTAKKRRILEESEEYEFESSDEEPPLESDDDEASFFFPSLSLTKEKRKVKVPFEFYTTVVKLYPVQYGSISCLKFYGHFKLDDGQDVLVISWASDYYTKHKTYRVIVPQHVIDFIKNKNNIGGLKKLISSLFMKSRQDGTNLTQDKKSIGHCLGDTTSSNNY